MRVIVLDADVLAQYGLQRLLSSSPGIILARQIKELPELTTSVLVDADVAIISLETIMSSNDPAEVIRDLADQVKVLVTSAKIDTDLVMMCLGAGAGGYIWRGVDPECICQAVQQVAVGEHPIMPPMAGELLFQLLSGGARRSSACHLGLTNREHEVLSLIANGMSNKEIAVALDLSVRTVKAHVSSVLQKLNVADRTQAAVMAIKSGVTNGDSINGQDRVG